MATPRVKGHRTGRRYWTQRGFLPAESSAFKNITKEAIEDSKYIPIMIETRMRRRRYAIQKGLNVRQYYTQIRQMYVKRGLATSAKSLEFDGVAGRRMAFDFFNQYKSKYAISDKSGKLIETPRKKVAVSKKPITGKRNIDQIIRKSQEEITYNRFRLQFEKKPFMQNVYRTTIQRHQQKIADLREQAKKIK